MAEAFLDRRREPRVPMKDDYKVGLPVGLTVHLVDISAKGILFFSPQKLKVGQKARLRTTLGAEPFNVDLEVRRVGDAGASGGGRGGYRIGAVFSTIDEASGRSVRHFLSGDFQ